MKECCDRCGEVMLCRTGSYFNTQVICDICQKKEEAHPMFLIAKAVENAAVKDGDFNFPGIGLPSDLMEGARNV